MLDLQLRSAYTKANQRYKVSTSELGDRCTTRPGKTTTYILYSQDDKAYTTEPKMCKKRTQTPLYKYAKLDIPTTFAKAHRIQSPFLHTHLFGSYILRKTIKNIFLVIIFVNIEYFSK